MSGDDQRDDPEKASNPEEKPAGDTDEPEQAGEKSEATAEESKPDEEPEPAKAEGESEPKEKSEPEEERDEASADRERETEPDPESEPDDEDADRADAEEPPAAPAEPEVRFGHERKAAAWGRPLARLDATWTKFEARLCAVVLILQIFALTFWVALKGLSTPPGSSSAGLVFRALVGAGVLSLAGFLALRKKGKKFERIGAIGGVVLGVVLARAWATAGVEWSSNLLNWYQQASFLTLLGGLRGVGTRLTLLLALLGGSLATAAGKHITIDVITRFLKPKARLPVMVVGWIGSAVICAYAAWGFLDHIAIEDFGAKADARPGEKFAEIGRDIGEDLFIARKQIALDFKTLPHVMGGKPYGEWLKGAEWNQWLESSGFVERYGKEAIEPLKMGDLESTRSPIVIVPERGEPRGELIKTANLVFPFGLFIIALRFILLSLLALSGHTAIDPEAHAEGSDIERKRGEGDGDAEEEKAS